MLVLSRKVGEKIVIGDTVVVQVLAVRRGQIRLGISAPPSVSIRREELPRHAPAGSAPAAGGLEGLSNAPPQRPAPQTPPQSRLALAT
jgi:carbon storage regulator